MYETFYGLTERPFNLTPDPRFLYLSEKHKEAFAHLLFGIKNRSGFVMVTGEIGTGKTTICRTLLGQLDDDTEVAFIFNPYLSPEELLRKINEDFGIDSKADTVKGLIDELNEYLLDRASKGKNCVLVIDEAQNLQPKVLEQIRLLSNLETETQKLIQIVLIGQPELGQHLELDELRQLNQRITARYHLVPLDQQETLQYIAYRLRVAGGRRKVRFTSGAVRSVYKLSKGVPRMINAICDRALLIGYTLEQADITPAIIKRSYKEIRGEHFRNRAKEFWRQLLPSRAFVGAAALIVLAGVVLVNPLGDQLRAIVRDVLNDAMANPASAANKPADNVVVAAVKDDPVAAIEPAEVTVLPAHVETQPDPLSALDTLGALDPAEARNAAVSAVFRMWNLALLGGFPEGDSIDDVIAFTRQNGLSCESLKPTLDQLLAINMPALIRVTISDKDLWVAVIGVEGDTWRVSAAQGKTLELAKSGLESIYAGEAAVPWLDPTPKASVLKQAMRSDAVRELQANLHTLGLLATQPTSVYDEATQDAVRRLQAQCGLNVDGIAGRQTRMVLCSWLPLSPSPQLSELPVAPAVQQVVAASSPAQSEIPPVTPEPASVPDTAVHQEAAAEPPVAAAPEPVPVENVAPVEDSADATAPEGATDPSSGSGEPNAPEGESPDMQSVDPAVTPAAEVAVEELAPPGTVTEPAAPVPSEGTRSGPLTVTPPAVTSKQTTAPAANNLPLVPSATTVGEQE